MLGLRPTIVLSPVLALNINTATAGSNRKHEPTRDDCGIKINKCKDICLTRISQPHVLSMLGELQSCKSDVGEFTCQFNCDCKTAKDNAIYRDSCQIQAPSLGARMSKWNEDIAPAFL